MSLVVLVELRSGEVTFSRVELHSMRSLEV